jgi:hypothetical protein
MPLPVGLLAAVTLTWLASRGWSALRRWPARPLAPGWLVAVPLQGCRGRGKISGALPPTPQLDHLRQST